MARKVRVGIQFTFWTVLGYSEANLFKNNISNTKVYGVKQWTFKNLSNVAQNQKHCLTMKRYVKFIFIQIPKTFLPAYTIIKVKFSNLSIWEIPKSWSRSKSWATDNVRIDGRKNSRKARGGNKWVTWTICIVWMDSGYEWTSHYLVSSMVISSDDMYQSSTSLHVILNLVHGPHTTNNVLVSFLTCLIKVIRKNHFIDLLQQLLLIGLPIIIIIILARHLAVVL